MICKIITTKMAEVDGPSSVLEENNASFQDENENTDEPKAKKVKLECKDRISQTPMKLEERLNGILCCTVCLDLPAKAVYQVSNRPNTVLCLVKC